MPLPFIDFDDLRPCNHDTFTVVLQKMLLALISPAAMQRAAAHANTDQVTASANGAACIPPRPTRRRLAWTNTSTTETVYVGFAAGVTASNGFPMTPGLPLALNYTGAVYLFSASGAVKIAYLETYD